MLSNYEVLEIFKYHTQWENSMIQLKLFDQNSLHLLKVDQLKKIIKELQRKGVTISSSGNKPDLVRHLSLYLSSKLDEEGSTRLPTSSSGNAALSIGQPSTHPTITARTILESRPTVSLTTAESCLVNELLQIDGLSKEEVIQSLLSIPSSERCFDSVLFNIINNRQNTVEKSLAAVAPVTEEDEIKQLDLILLESEKERDNIQVCTPYFLYRLHLNFLLGKEKAKSRDPPC
jgi:hypothetical protein